MRPLERVQNVLLLAAHRALGVAPKLSWGWRFAIALELFARAAEEDELLWFEATE